jgi:oligopeptide transport system substrate-binding protein
MKRLAYLIFFFLAACGAAPKKETASLRLAFNAAPTTLDPRKSGDFISSTLICLIYEGLTRCLPGGGVEPALAEKIEISPDGRVYTFFLRKAYWSDGHPVTAADFEKSWKKIIDPSFSSLSSYLLFPIKNAEKFYKREVGIEDVAIHALDEKTLQVELEHPAPFFLSLTAFPLFLPVPAHLEEVTGSVANGPFRIEKERQNNEIILAKNPVFWNGELSPFDEIRIQIVADENTALQMFERGEIDWLGAPLAPLPPDSIQALKEKIQFIPMAASTILTFNTKEFPFENPKLRKALALCLDRQQIVTEIALEGQIPAARVLPPSLFDRPLKPLYPEPDAASARVLFEESLEELGATASDLEALTLYYKPVQADKRLAQVLQREWKEALGFTIQIEQLEPKTHLDRLHRRDYKIALGSWISQFDDPVNILERYRLPTNKKNFAGWENGVYRALLEEASSIADPRKRLELLAEAEEIFANELPALTLYHWSSPSIANPRIKELSTTPCGGVLFERFTF